MCHASKRESSKKSNNRLEYASTPVSISAPTIEDEILELGLHLESRTPARMSCDSTRPGSMEQQF